MTNPNGFLRCVLSSILGLAVTGAGCEKRIPDSHPRDTAGRQRSAVTALGRVTPGRAVISIAAPPETRVSRLEVSDGKKVNAGDVLAYLDTYPLRIAERDAAQIALDEARERLKTETAYAEAVLNQSRQAVRLLELAVEHERRELDRIKTLTSTKALPEQRLVDQKFVFESRELELGKASAELAASQAALARARTLVGVASAEAQVKRAEAQLELTIIRAPISGEILKVFTYPGERIGSAPILKMGNTADMHVIAEVHETDIGAVRVGQRATITSDALAEPVHGVVEEIGALISKNDVFDLDPRADQDTRVVEVRVKLDNADSVARLTHLEVSTRIDLGPPPDSKSAAR